MLLRWLLMTSITQLVTKGSKLKMKKHLSFSQLNTYLGCGESYRLSYVEGNRSAPNIAMVKGTSFHRVAEINNTQKMESKKDMSLEEMLDIASSQIDKAFKLDLYLKRSEQSMSKKSLHGEAKDSLLATIPGLHKHSQGIQPIAIEKEYDIKIPGVDRHVKAFIDLITDDNRVIDYKLTAKAKSQSATENDLQLALYSLIHKIYYGSFPRVQFHNYVSKKSKKTGEHSYSFNILETEDIYCESKLQPLLSTIKTVEESIQKGVFLPAESGSWRCSPNMCSHYQSCKYVKQENNFSRISVPG